VNDGIWEHKCELENMSYAIAALVRKYSIHESASICRALLVGLEVNFHLKDRVVFVKKLHGFP
jgi:hypothetical protein